jgi:glutamate-1-semialdehyde 2,1-aminomutase
MTFQLGDHSAAAQRLYVRKMHERGFLVSSTFYLMYAHEEQHIAELLETINIVLGEMEQTIASGRLASHEGSQAGFARLA